MLYIHETKPDLAKPHGRPVQSGPRAPRLSAWRPQPSGLTREEIRKIVLDMLG